MGVQSLKSSGGVDWSKYNILAKELSFINSPTPYTYSTVLSVNGKGYIKDATCIPVNSSGGIKITIDGVVIFESFGFGNDLIGILQQESISIDDSLLYGRASSQINSIQAVPKTYPYISNVSNSPQTNYDPVVCILPQPIFFKSSLTIQLRHAESSGIAHITVNGGIL